MAGTPVDRVGHCLAQASLSILSLGSGDGSQQRGIVERGHVNVMTTFFDSEAEVLAKYPTAQGCIDYLRQHSRHGVLFGIDASKLSAHAAVLGKHDIVMFYFPHTGVPNNNSSNIKSNQTLLRSFLSEAPGVVKASGSIQIAVKTGQPYDDWSLDTLIDQSAGLEMISCSPVQKSQFPGYVHRLTKGAAGVLTSVKDDGAMLYELGAVGAPAAEESPSTRLQKMDIDISLLVVAQSTLLDSEVKFRVLQILKDSKDATVLDIRRHFDASLLPDTRQLNRILYELLGSKHITKCPPLANGRKSQKPTWKLSAD